MTNQNMVQLMLYLSNQPICWNCTTVYCFFQIR